MTILNPCEWWAYYGGGSSCNVYLFNSSNPDSLQLGSLFTGNIKVILAGTSTAGIHPDILSGLQGSFVTSSDLLDDPQWNQLESNVTDLSYIVDNTFTGRLTYAKDDVWYKINMGVPSTPPEELGQYNWQSQWEWN